MGMTLKELLTKGEGTLTAGEAKTLASQCRMDVETLYTLLEERGIKILDDEADGDTSLDVEGIMAEVESAEANSDELGLGDENEDDPAEENPADLKAAMDELLDDPVKNYLKQIGQIPLLSAEQEVDLSKRIHLCCVVHFHSPSHHIFPQKGHPDGMFSTFTAHISAVYVDHQSLRRKKKTVRPHKERTAKYTHDTQI